jgi:DNA replication protein DnaC
VTGLLELGVHSELDPPSEWEERCDGRVSIVDQSGPIWTVRCERCGFETGLPARNADPSLRRRLRERQAGFPARFAGVRFQEDPTNASALRTVRAWVGEFKDRPLPAPAIHGQPGRGKSHLAVAVCTRLIRDHDAAVLFRSSARLLDELQDGFDQPGEYGTLWHRAVTVDVLALDDLGAERPTEWRTDRLARLVDERWERELPVLVATNYPPAMWDEAFDARTASRLRGMTFAVQLGGADRRQMAMGCEALARREEA